MREEREGRVRMKSGREEMEGREGEKSGKEEREGREGGKRGLLQQGVTLVYGFNYSD